MEVVEAHMAIGRVYVVVVGIKLLLLEVPLLFDFQHCRYHSSTNSFSQPLRIETPPHVGASACKENILVLDENACHSKNGQVAKYT